MFTCQDFNVGEMICLITKGGTRVIGRVRDLDITTEAIEMNATTTSSTGRLYIPCSDIMCVGAY